MSLLVAACLAGPLVEKPMTPTLEDVQRKFARIHNFDTNEVEVTLLAAPAVPGLVLYRAVVVDRLWSGVVVRGSEVIVDPRQEREAIVRAWGYGQARTAPPADVAAALLITMGDEEEPRLVVTPERSAHLGRLGVAGVSVPVETTEDGLPGVRFWYGTGYNPATEVIAVFKPDGTVEVRTGRTHGGG